MLSTKVTRIHGKTFVEVTLLSNIIGVDLGEWFLLAGLDKVSVHVEGIINATCQLRGSNVDISPINDGVQLGNDITVDQIIYFKVPLKWIKVKVATYVSGEISAYLVGE